MYGNCVVFLTFVLRLFINQTEFFERVLLAISRLFSINILHSNFCYEVENYLPRSNNNFYIRP